MSETKKIAVGPAKREELDDIVRKAAKPNAVEAKLDSRYTYKDEGKVRWGAYERYLLSNGHTLYLNLQTKEASVSKEPDKFAQAKVAKREAKAAKRAAAKLAREEKAKVKADAQKTEPKAEPKPKAAKRVKTVKFDPKLPTVEA